MISVTEYRKTSNIHFFLSVQSAATFGLRSISATPVIHDEVAVSPSPVSEFVMEATKMA